MIVPPEEKGRGPWAVTYTGKKVYPFAMQREDLCIEDIAHHLSLEPRFGGACRFHYSVAQHSLLVAQFLAPKHALLGLLHDAPEAYLRDLSRLVKPHLWLRHPDLQIDYEFANAQLLVLMGEVFGFATTPEALAALHEADDRALALEAATVLRQPLCPGWELVELSPEDRQISIVPMGPSLVETVFLKRFREFTTQGCPAMTVIFRQQQPWHF